MLMCGGKSQICQNSSLKLGKSVHMQTFIESLRLIKGHQRN